MQRNRDNLCGGVVFSVKVIVSKVQNKKKDKRRHTTTKVSLLHLVKTVRMSETLFAIYSGKWQIFMAARCRDSSIADKEVGK